MSGKLNRSILFFFTVYLTISFKAGSAEEIIVSYAALTAAYMDHIVAIEKGYILEEGLNVKPKSGVKG